MKYLYVGATADVDREAFTAVGERMGREFGLPLREYAMPDLEFARDPRRNQYGSIPVLEKLVKAYPGDAVKLLAVTGRDLFIPVLTFVYGHAQLGGRIAVISLARLRQEFYGLDPDRNILIQRATKEALHESGHLFGLVHCPDISCAMSLSTNIRQIDLKRAAFCASCAARLGRRPRES